MAKILEIIAQNHEFSPVPEDEEFDLIKLTNTFTQNNRYVDMNMIGI
jgi:hypothetical protein